MLLIKKDSIFSFLLDYILGPRRSLKFYLSFQKKKNLYVLNANAFSQSLLKFENIS